MHSYGREQRGRLLNFLASTLLLFLCLPTALTHALPDDRDQPIRITADKALRDEINGVTVYSGNVQFVQGSMELESDKLTIYHTSEDAEEIVAEGLPAKMRQQPEIDKGIVHAHGEVIKYYRKEDRVLLQKNARIEQDGAVVAGNSIEYLIAKQLTTAESDPANPSGPVVVVIPPSVRKKEDNGGAAQSK
jgi:lipopolysaccharide export system protein LptA